MFDNNKKKIDERLQITSNTPEKMLISSSKSRNVKTHFNSISNRIGLNCRKRIILGIYTMHCIQHPVIYFDVKYTWM